MKVVLLTSVPASLQFLKGHIRFLQSKGVEIHVISSPAPALQAFGDEFNVETHGIDLPRRISPLRDLVSFWRLARRLRRIRPDIVHSHTPKAGLLGTLAASVARVPVRLYHLHGLPLATATGIKRWILRLCDATACRLSQQVFCVSPSLQQEVIRERICPASKLAVLEQGTIDGIEAQSQFDPARFAESEIAAARRALGLPTGARVLGFVGRLVADKGIHELLASFSDLKREFSDLQLLVVGAWEPGRAISSEARTALGSDPHICLAGFARDPAIYYALMDVLAFPTHREGFGLVAAEAAAMQVPVVATRIPGCIDAVQADVNGILVTPGNVQELTAAIARYLRDPELRRRHGRAGRIRVLRDFRPAQIHEAMWQRYAFWVRSKRRPIQTGDAQVLARAAA